MQVKTNSLEPSTVASQKAKYTARVLNRLVRDRPLTDAFQFRSQGNLAYLGDWYDLSLVFHVSSNVDQLIYAPPKLGKLSMTERLSSQVRREKTQGMLAILIAYSADIF